jgi:membrane protein
MLYRSRRILHYNEEKYRQAVRFRGVKLGLFLAYQNLIRHHTLQVAAALSYYFVLSVFPALIFLSAILGLLPRGDLFNQILTFMGRILPSDTMRIVQSVLHDVFSAHRGTWLSFGMLSIAWTASSSFAAIIEALDIAYDANDDRPYWKTRLLSIALATISGGLLLTAFAVMIVGPRFGDWLAAQLGLSGIFATIWPALRWSIAIGFTIIAVEIIYFLGPNVRQRFAATLPGAIFSVVVWNVLSYLLEIYFAHFAHFSHTYGTLAGVVALMTWLYWTSFALLVGAELNAELAKQSKKGGIQSRSGEDESQASTVTRAA